MGKTFLKNIKLSKNKSIEFQLDIGHEYGMASEWFELNVGTRSKQDHGGFHFNFIFMNIFALMIQFYDHRHWNYEANRWYHYNSESED